MFNLTCSVILFTFNALSHPGDQINDEPTSIRSFSPESEVNDDIIETYFTQSGPLSIEFYEHLTLLANPWLGGRQPGTEGSRIAGEYIVWNLSKNGIVPAFEDQTDWYQRFDFSVDSAPTEVLSSFASIDDMAFIEGRDYAVLGNSGSGEVEAPVTFVGYAIEEGESNYTSFNPEDDLTGQIALMLRYEPLDEDGASQWAGRRFSPHSNIREKMNAVIQRGAVGVILVNPPYCRDGRSGLETSSSSRFGTTNIPVVHMTEDVINTALKDYTVRSLQSKADSGEVRTMPMMINATLKTEVNTGGMQAKNIGGILKGKGELADEWLIIGGHYDHVGYGYVGTRYPGQLHHGADDNASGTSLILILSRLLSKYYTESDDESLRSVMFLFFDAEEAGLHGSAHFVKYPIIKLADVNAMINIDMVGNLSQNNVMIGGTGTAAEFDSKIPEWIQSSILTASLMPSGTGPSDHTNFYQAGMPVLFFFTGLTDEYHTPKDQPYTTNPAGAARLASLINTVAIDLVDEEKLSFQTSSSSSRRGGNRGSVAPPASVRLGIQPSYSAELETGILINGVSEGTSAEDAGLQDGDVLLEWNGIELTGGMELMNQLRAAKPGYKVTILVQRDTKNIDIEVTLKAP